MGHLATTWAWQQPVKGNAKLLLLALADTANNEGVCWPGTRRVAEMVGLSERAVREQLTKLEEAGVLRREPRFRPDGSQTSNLTILNLPGGLRLAAGGDCGAPHPGQEPSEEPSERTSPPKTPSPREHDEFGEWIGHHSEVTTQRVPRAGTKARAHVASMYLARREEGWTHDELKLAVDGAFADEFRKANGYYDPESVLRPTKVGKLVEAGRRARAAAASHEPTWAERNAARLEELSR